VPGAGAGQASFAASALDPSTGNEVLAWLEIGSTSSPLRLARCAANCATPSPTWTVVTVDDLGATPFTWATGLEPRPLDLKIATTGTAVLAYGTGAASSPACSLRIATVTSQGSVSRTGIAAATGCDAGGTVGSQVGRWVSLALQGDSPAVAASYQDRTASTSYLGYVECSTVDCASVNGTLVGPVFPNANGARWPSLAVTASGLQLVHQEDVGGFTHLDYAECSAGCANAASWTRRALPGSSSTFGRYASLAPTSTGKPGLAYADANAIYTGSCDLACASSGAWTTQNVTSLNTLTGLALATDASDHPWIAAREGYSGTLQLLTLTAFARPYSLGWQVDSVSGPSPSILLPASGSVRISAGDGGALKTVRYGQ
jgi:hypothetical protein